MARKGEGKNMSFLIKLVFFYTFILSASSTTTSSNVNVLMSMFYLPNNRDQLAVIGNLPHCRTHRGILF